jgi:DNA-binding CsgD family transcriptional regulator
MTTRRSPSATRSKRGQTRKKSLGKVSNYQRRRAGMSPQLTAAERQVVRLLSLGCTVAQVAAILKKSPHTIDNQKSSAMAKLKTDKVALLTRLAIKLGISPLEDRLTRAEKRASGRKADGWN